MKTISNAMKTYKLLPTTLPMLALVCAGLFLFPVHRLRLILHRWACRFPRTAPADYESLGKAITMSSRIIPSARCLARALTFQFFSNRNGTPVFLRIGITTSRNQSAHAWLEYQGKVIFGGAPNGLKNRTVPLSFLKSGNRKERYFDEKAP